MVAMMVDVAPVSLKLPHKEQGAAAGVLHTTVNRQVFLGQKPRNICWWLRNITYVPRLTREHNRGIYLHEHKTARTSELRNITFVPHPRGTEEHKSLCSSANRGIYLNLRSSTQNRGTYANLCFSAEIEEHIRPYVPQPKIEEHIRPYIPRPKTEEHIRTYVPRPTEEHIRTYVPRPTEEHNLCTSVS
jgi:hypothetical protein